MGLAQSADNRLELLSKGMVQKVQFLAAILHDPDLIILDELFSGLDPVSARTVRELILEQRSRGAAILFSTHVTSFAEELCDHVVIIAGGRKVLDTPMAALRRKFVPRTLLLEPLDQQIGLDGIRKLPEVEKIEPGERTELIPCCCVKTSHLIAHWRASPIWYRWFGASCAGRASKTFSSRSRHPHPWKFRRSPL